MPQLKKLFIRWQREKRDSGKFPSSLQTQNPLYDQYDFSNTATPSLTLSPTAPSFHLSSPGPLTPVESYFPKVLALPAVEPDESLEVPSKALPVGGVKFRRNAEKERFILRYPGYLDTGELDSIRSKYYARLDEREEVYLDYTGGGLYPSHIIQNHLDLLQSSVFGNPHSTSPSSLLSTRHEQAARSAVLDFLDADPNEYDVIFTPNASGGFKVIADNYRWKDTRLILTKDGHNSMMGLGRICQQSGGQVEFIEVTPEYVVDEQGLRGALEKDHPGMAVFTGQSNITSAKLDPTYLELARSKGWIVGLDAAALAPTTEISLKKTPLDWIALSHYKIIGYPTGIGYLVVSRRLRNILLANRKTFGGGTVTAVWLPSLDYTLYPNHMAFEEGTINYLALPAVAAGLRFVKPLIPLIQKRTKVLIEYLFEELSMIRYNDGTKTRMIEVANPNGPKGGTLTCVFSRPGEEGLGLEAISFVVAQAAKRRISIRGGPCLCNPGAAVMVMHKPQLMQDHPEDQREQTMRDWRDGDYGIIRISVGLVSNFDDCQKFVEMCRDLSEMKTYEREKKAWEEKRTTCA